MGTEVCSSIGSLVTQLENAKRGLQKIDETIKKIVQTTGRFQNDRNSERNFQSIPNENPRTGPRVNRGNFYQDSPNNRSFDDDRQGRKRPQETKTVFSRLSARPSGGDSDGDDELPFSKKPRISSQVIRELPTKQEVLKAQSGDEVSKARNRRMFGSLLGTLQKFKQEEIVLKNKEDKKAQVEKKIEEQAKQEKENQKKERQSLFAEREMKKATIKALEAKMIRMQTYEVWESTQKPLLNFVQTKWKPHIVWLPKKMNNQAQEKLDFSRKKQEKIIEKKQQELKEELEAIEQRCIRNVKLPPGIRNRQVSLSTSTDQTDQDQTIDPEDTMEAEDIPDIHAHPVSVIDIKIKDEEEEYKNKKERVSTDKSSRFKTEKEEKPNKNDINNGEASPEEQRHSHDDDDADDDNHKHDSHHDSEEEDKSTNDQGGAENLLNQDSKNTEVNGNQNDAEDEGNLDTKSTDNNKEDDAVQIHSKTEK